MKVLIDADACPVVDIAIELCGKYDIKCLLFCDTAHQMRRSGAETFVADQGADSVDFLLFRYVEPGDLIITQDYGLAALCISKKATAIHQDGWEYTQENIDALLWSRYETKKYRMAGGRTKGPHKRTDGQNRAFRIKMSEIINQNKSQGKAFGGS